MAEGELAPYGITLDTSALFAFLNRRDIEYSQVSAILVADPGPILLPAAILREITYLVEERLPPSALFALLSDIETGGYTLDCGENDIPQIRDLIQRYDDLPLGFADASVVACGERHGGRVLTLDRRHFGVVAREGRIKVLPD